MMKTNNKEISGVVRKRQCNECAALSEQEIVFENNVFVAYCLECGNEIILAKGNADD